MVKVKLWLKLIKCIIFISSKFGQTSENVYFTAAATETQHVEQQKQNKEE
jgi:hypothetical protein